MAALSFILILHLLVVASFDFDRIEGIKEVVSYLERVAPQGRYLYDGKYDGIFSFYVRSQDTKFERGVVLGDKLFYSLTMFRRNLKEYVESPSDIVKTLQSQCGCQWLAIEKQGEVESVAAARYLREAVKGVEFQHMKSFAIHAPDPTRIDVYRFLPPITVPEKLELQFPSLGKGTKLSASPVTR